MIAISTQIVVFSHGCESLTKRPSKRKKINNSIVVYKNHQNLDGHDFSIEFDKMDHENPKIGILSIQKLIKLRDYLNEIIENRYKS